MNKVGPKVTIIVPNFNHCKFLNQRLDSIINQTFYDFDIILLDDASSDNSLTILDTISNHPKVSEFIVNDKNSGSPFSQWDKGIKLAKGELIWIAESDDRADYDFLKTLVPIFTDNKVALAYCATYNIDEHDNIIEENSWNNILSRTHWSRNYINDGNNEIKKYLAYKNTIFNASSVVFRKNLYFEVEFNSNLFYFGDWLLWSLLIKDKKISYNSKILNYFRQHEKTTRATKSFIEETKRIKEAEHVINKITKHNNIKINIINSLKWNWIFSKIIQNRKLFKTNLLLHPPTMQKKIFYFVFYTKLIYTFLKNCINKKTYSRTDTIS